MWNFGETLLEDIFEDTFRLKTHPSCAELFYRSVRIQGGTRMDRKNPITAWGTPWQHHAIQLRLWESIFPILFQPTVCLYIPKGGFSRWISQTINTIHNWLVVSTPLKNISQNGNLPQIGMEIKKYLKPPPRQRQDSLLSFLMTMASVTATLAFPTSRLPGLGRFGRSLVRVSIQPWNIIMEHNHGGLENICPF